MTDKTIADKMYLKTARSLVVFNGAVHPRMVAMLPQELIVDSTTEQAVDAVLLFALNQKQLEDYFPSALARVADKGSLWIAFLKSTAPKATDIDRDTIFAWAKQRGATGVALISMDADWSAVRLKRM